MLRARALEADLQGQQVRGLGDLSYPELLGFAPPKARDAEHLSALVRALAVYLETRGVLRCPPLSRTQILAGTYRDHLIQVRGYAHRTADNHAALARELLGFLRFEENPGTLRTLGPSDLEAFVKAVAARQGRPALRNTAARLRSFLRFLAAQGQVATGLDALIDTPPVYRGETLPRALPLEHCACSSGGHRPLGSDGPPRLRHAPAGGDLRPAFLRSGRLATRRPPLAIRRDPHPASQDG